MIGKIIQSYDERINESLEQFVSGERDFVNYDNTPLIQLGGKYI